MGVHKGLVALVIGMGVLIVAGLVAVGWGIARKATTVVTHPAPVAGKAGTVDVPLLRGESVTVTFPVGDRIAVVLSGGLDGDRILFADPVSGAVTSILRLKPAGADTSR